MKTKKLLVLSGMVLSTVAVTTLGSCSGSTETYDYTYAELLGTTSEDYQEAQLGAYNTKYEAAAAIVDTTKTDERYKAFAEAEYNLIYEEGLIIPWLTQSGYQANVSKTVPWQAGRATYGLTSDKYKNVVVTNSPMTQDQRAKVTADYNAKKAEHHDPIVDPDGYTELTNFYSNPKLASDGKYTVGAGTENEITFDTKNTFKSTYTAEPTTFSPMTSQWTYNSYHFCNMIDGLVENDKFGNLVGAIATAYKVEELDDGRETWTFKLRDDATWVKNEDGTKYADVVADDFVASAEYVLTAANGSPTANILASVIDKAEDFYNGDVESFSEVGVKAIDAHTLQYTLTQATPYFLSMLTYAPFLPVNRAFLAAKGTDFGKTENDVLVNGAFRITAHEQNTNIEYTKNDSYYDKDHVYFDHVKRTFIASATRTPTTLRTYYENGDIDAFNVDTSDETGMQTYVYGDAGTGTVKDPANPVCNGVLSVGGATYIGYFNLNRYTFEWSDNANRKTKAQNLATAKAIGNKNFRLGFLYGLDVMQELKMYDPNNPENWLMRGYTNRELVTCNNKDYADYVDDVYNEKQRKQYTYGVTLTGINQGFDPIYSLDKARNYFKNAKAELLEAGLTDSDFPVRIDMIGEMDTTTAAFQTEVTKALSADTEISKIVKFVYNTPTSDDQNTEWGSVTANYDFSMWSGWGPDYADPNTYLHTMAIDGDLVSNMGF